MKELLIILYFSFIVYYLFVLYVFNKLQQNQCNCAKLEKFKQTWNFKYVIIASIILLGGNLYFLYKLLNRIQSGGSLNALYFYTIIFISIGYSISFLNDYAIFDLFKTMKQNDCPCNVDNRQYLLNATIGKLVVNLLLFISSLSFINSKKFNKLAKFIIKRMKQQ